jgi:hypothetical protein
MLMKKFELFLLAARLKINSEFRKYQRISNQEAITEVSLFSSICADQTNLHHVIFCGS